MSESKITRANPVICKCGQTLTSRYAVKRHTCPPAKAVTR